MQKTVSNIQKQKKKSPLRTYTIRNVKGCPSSRRTMIPDKNLALHKEWRALEVELQLNMPQAMNGDSFCGGFQDPRVRTEKYSAWTDTHQSWEPRIPKRWHMWLCYRQLHLLLSKTGEEGEREVSLRVSRAQDVWGVETCCPSCSYG